MPEGRKARTSARAGIGRAGITRAGYVSGGTDKLMPRVEGGTQKLNPWTKVAAVTTTWTTVTP